MSAAVVVGGGHRQPGVPADRNHGMWAGNCRPGRRHPSFVSDKPVLRATRSRRATKLGVPVAFGGDRRNAAVTPLGQINKRLFKTVCVVAGNSWKRPIGFSKDVPGVGPSVTSNPERINKSDVAVWTTTIGATAAGRSIPAAGLTIAPCCRAFGRALTHAAPCTGRARRLTRRAARLRAAAESLATGQSWQQANQQQPDGGSPSERSSDVPHRHTFPGSVAQRLRIVVNNRRPLGTEFRLLPSDAPRQSGGTLRLNQGVLIVRPGLASQLSHPEDFDVYGRSPRFRKGCAVQQGPIRNFARWSGPAVP